MKNYREVNCCGNCAHQVSTAWRGEVQVQCCISLSHMEDGPDKWRREIDCPPIAVYGICDLHEPVLNSSIKPSESNNEK